MSVDQSIQSQLQHRRLRAPKKSGQRLMVPAFLEFGKHWLSNIAVLDSHDFQIAGQGIREFRRQAREELLTRAKEHTFSYRDVRVPVRPKGIVLAGHQPTLFHPGVWFKNFALSRLTNHFGAVGINLIIDNDLNQSNMIRVPAGSLKTPRIQYVAFDDPDQGVPFEATSIKNHHLWSSFGQRVSETIQPLVANPLVRRLWPHVRKVSQQGFENPGQAIAAGRHRLEAEFGLNTLEVPLSTLCNSYWFASFCAALLLRATELRLIYNRTLAEYRRRNRIRSNSHPVPELTERDGWMESPFWVWSRKNPVRRRLFVRTDKDSVRIDDGFGWQHQFEKKNLCESLFALESSDVMLRPRALTTTMYARLILGQAFLHGIGGAKYDHLTDEIMRQFFDMQPPAFCTMTATHRLPLDLPDVDEQDLTEMDVRLRELRFHPEHYIPAGDEMATRLLATKKNLIKSIPATGSKLKWHQQMESVNEDLRALVEPERRTLLQQKSAMQESLIRQRVLTSREFSFCLFPESLANDLM